MNTKLPWSGLTAWGLILLASIIVPSCGGHGNGGSTSPAGSGNASVSANGRVVAFDSSFDTQGSAGLFSTGTRNGNREIFVTDSGSGTTRQITSSQGGSSNPSLSADGQSVAFESNAASVGTLTGGTNGAGLTVASTTPGSTSGQTQIFVTKLMTGQTRLVSTAEDGTPSNGNNSNPSISGDGQSIAFESDATNLGGGGAVGNRNVFVVNAAGGPARLVSAGGNSTNPVISADGRSVAFESTSGDLHGSASGTSSSRIFVRDLVNGSTTQVAPDLTGNSIHPSISSDGRLVAFESSSSASGHSNIFLWDRVTAQTTMLTVPIATATSGSVANGGSHDPFVSGDGRFVAFDSNATNLTPGFGGQAGGDSNVFVRDLATGVTRFVSQPITGATTVGSTTAGVTTSGVTTTSNTPTSGSRKPVLSQDGSVVVFTSNATNLTNEATGGISNVFMSGPGNSPITLVSQPPPTPTTSGTSVATTGGMTGATTVGTTFGTTVGTTLGTTTRGTTTGGTTSGTTTTGSTFGTTTTGTTFGTTTTGTTFGTTTAGTTFGTTVGTTTGATTIGTTTVGTTMGTTTVGSTVGSTAGVTTGTTGGTTTVGTTVGSTAGVGSTGALTTDTTGGTTFGPTFGTTGGGTTGAGTTR